MGSSLGIGHGIKKASQQKLIAFIGDSTFFHSGIPALINTVINRSNPLIIILDNRTTAMTGHQPSPGEKIAIEEIVKACGVKNIKVLDPANQKEMIEAVKDFLDKEEVSVIISRHPCLFVK
jgi:indolepyruvate ferredoxin oxidoreductase alpha subunit